MNTKLSAPFKQNKLNKTLKLLFATSFILSSSVSYAVSLPAPDSDTDGIVDFQDNCPLVPNAGQWDQDKDGIGNECDTDIDGDGCANDIEDALGTKKWVASSVPEVCEMPQGDDIDGDGIVDDIDNCPSTANKGQWDKDDDGIGNVCDDDIDGDGCANYIEIARGTKVWDQQSVPLDCSKPIGDDIDNDGIIDDLDNCPTIANSGQWDKDKDEIGNVCDDDIDGDGHTNIAEEQAGTKVWDPAPPYPPHSGTCRLLDGQRFISTSLGEGGLSLDGVSWSHWDVTFDDDQAYFMQSDFGQSATFSCIDDVITFSVYSGANEYKKISAELVSGEDIITEIRFENGNIIGDELKVYRLAERTTQNYQACQDVKGNTYYKLSEDALYPNDFSFAYSGQNVSFTELGGERTTGIFECNTGDLHVHRAPDDAYPKVLRFNEDKSQLDLIDLTPNAPKKVLTSYAIEPQICLTVIAPACAKVPLLSDNELPEWMSPSHEFRTINLDGCSPEDADIVHLDQCSESLEGTSTNGDPTIKLVDSFPSSAWAPIIHDIAILDDVIYFDISYGGCGDETFNLNVLKSWKESIPAQFDMSLSSHDTPLCKAMNRHKFSYDLKPLTYYMYDNNLNRAKLVSEPAFNFVDYSIDILPVVVSDELPNTADIFGVDVSKTKLVDDLLKIDVSYSGCDLIDLDLQFSRAWLESNPVQIESAFTFRNPKDIEQSYCDAVISTTLNYDLKPLKEALEQSGETQAVLRDLNMDYSISRSPILPTPEPVIMSDDLPFNPGGSNIVSKATLLDDVLVVDFSYFGCWGTEFDLHFSNTWLESYPVQIESAFSRRGQTHVSAVICESDVKKTRRYDLTPLKQSLEQSGETSAILRDLGVEYRLEPHFCIDSYEPSCMQVQLDDSVCLTPGDTSTCLTKQYKTIDVNNCSAKTSASFPVLPAYLTYEGQCNTDLEGLRSVDIKPVKLVANADEYKEKPEVWVTNTSIDNNKDMIRFEAQSGSCGPVKYDLYMDKLLANSGDVNSALVQKQMPSNYLVLCPAVIVPIELSFDLKPIKSEMKELGMTSLKLGDFGIYTPAS